MITTKDIRDRFSGSGIVVSKRNGVFTLKKSYYWGFTNSGEGLATKIRELYPNALIIDYGNHFHGFVGSAKSGSPQDSYLWVKFTLPGE